MSQASQQLIAGHGTAQFRTGKTTAGNDQLIHRQGFLTALQPEALLCSFYFRHFKAGFQLNVGLVQSKTQHIHHRICLVRIWIDSAGILRHGKKAQPGKPAKGILRTESLDRFPRKYGIITVVSLPCRMKICQVTSSVSRRLELSAYPCLPFQQNYLYLGILRGSQSRGHTGSSRSNNTDHHKITCFPSYHYILRRQGVQGKNFPCNREKPWYNTI